MFPSKAVPVKSPISVHFDSTLLNITHQVPDLGNDITKWYRRLQILEGLPLVLPGLSEVEVEVQGLCNLF